MTKTYSYNHLLTLFNDIAYDYRFLFQGLTDHPPRHSFPTRRSSDLCLPYSGFRWNSGPHLLAVSGQECYLKTATDRKSTRLNSSHVAISYAVFCLKKKKIKKQLSRKKINRTNYSQNDLPQSQESDNI